MPHKKVRKEVELPSFLLELNAVPEDVSFPPRTTSSSHYLGPIFFGQSNLHPPLHSLNFSSFRHIQKTYSAKENIQDLFLEAIPEKTGKIKKCFKRPQLLKSVAKKKDLYSDPYPHRAPGVRKVFVPEIEPSELLEPGPYRDLGETTSEIVGETTLEIPLHRLHKGPSSSTEPELVMLSEFKEKKRILMPYKERISHTHYPKEFATVKVIGPTIPAAITITKLPSKRKTEFEMSALINSIDRKSSREEMEETKEETPVVIQTEPKVISLNEDQLIKIRSGNSNVGISGVDETQEEDGYRGFNSEINKLEVEEETPEIREGENEAENEEIDSAVELLPVQEEDEKEENNENIAEKEEENPNEEEPED